MHINYRNPVLRELRDQQVRFAPREKKIEQANRAEQLLAEIESNRSYRYDYLCFRITDFRPEAYPDLKVTGDDARHDLRLFVEDVSDAADIGADTAGEPVLTVEQVGAMYKVSTKTVGRWREQGLVSRRFVFGGRKRVGFLKSSVDRFVLLNRERVQRGARFSQMSDDERNEMIEMARRLARAGGCPGEVARRIARRMDRSVETVRYTLKSFDEQHPDIAIFSDRFGPLTDAAKQKIFEEFRRGVSAETLARDYCRTRTSVYRVVNEVRAKHLLELPLDYMDSPEFKRADASARILAPMPASSAEQARKVRPPKGLPAYLNSLYEVPLLTREQEVHLFRKMNFLKFQAAKLREGLQSDQPRSGLMDEIEKLHEEAVAAKNQIVKANLRLVVSIAKRHVTANNSFFELVSDGNVSLMRAVEKFDYTRGNKFSTYASWSLMKNFARSIPDEHRQRDRFRTSQDEKFGATPDNRADEFAAEISQSRRELHVEKMLGCLDEREQKIIVRRFGLDHRHEPLTLKEVGAELGVTKERVRQIEARAIDKLRHAAEEEKVVFDLIEE